jgi:3',5'-cyclic AMP phosphodiesterase CpdA
VSRRLFMLAATLITIAILAVAVTLATGSADEPAPPPSDPSTLAGTWVDSDGNGTLGRGPGEAPLERTDLAPASGISTPLATLVQITDTHVRDEESPARASLLDRVDPDLNSAFRPQESLSPQVLEAIVTSTNVVAPDAVLLTGDLVDSDQENELDQFRDVIVGGEVHPDTGAPGYAGPQDASNPDPFFYRPDLDAPVHPGLLDQAEQPFASPGLDAPWYPLVGNHDLLVQGEVPSTPALDRLATGDRLLTGIRKNLKLPKRRPEEDRGDQGNLQLPEESALTPGLVDEVIGRGLPGPTEQVAPDPERRHLPAADVLSQLRAASGEGGSGPLMDYSFDVGPDVRVIALDLVNRAGGSGGIVSPGQPAWLRQELAAAGGRTVIVMSHQPLTSSRGGGRLLAALDDDPDVLATLNGDTHKNSITPRDSPAGGYWQISTSSLADYPQQARVLRIVRTEDGGVAIDTWMIDGTGAPLADTARQLSYLDAQGGRPQGDAGEPGDRNAILFR